MNNSEIIAFEKCLPEKIVSNDDLSKFLETSDEWISTRTGIRQRHFSMGESTSDICAIVARGLLEKAGMSAEEIDIIIVATISPDYFTPSTACIVQEKIGACNSFAFDINAACSGFIYALSIGDKMIKSGIYNNALIIGGEIMSNLVNWEDRSTCVLFGDGAGGALLKRSDSRQAVICEDLHTDASKYKAILGHKVPVQSRFMQSDYDGSEDYFTMDGRSVFNFAVKRVPEGINKIIEKSGISIDDIKYIVPHQANLRIVEAVAKKLKLPMEKFFINIDKTGNTSAASVPIALAQMTEDKLIEKGDKVIITGFGAGLTWGTILLEI
ncbi:MAG: ketoacyl-ACP synthase III [Firmicutes bacterium]|nr:ketoacyl-ACP synthase III [Bacillota bacterium]